MLIPLIKWTVWLGAPIFAWTFSVNVNLRLATLDTDWRGLISYWIRWFLVQVSDRQAPIQFSASKILVVLPLALQSCSFFGAMLQTTDTVVLFFLMLVNEGTYRYCAEPELFIQYTSFYAADLFSELVRGITYKYTHLGMVNCRLLKFWPLTCR